MRWKDVIAGLGTVTLACGVILTIASCNREPGPDRVDRAAFKPAPDAAYQKEIEKWRSDRLASLTSEDGWLTLIGLYWLQPGANSVGSKDGSVVELPKNAAPPDVGTFLVQDGKIHFKAAPNAGVTRDGAPVTELDLATDASGNPTALQLGTLQFYPIERGGKIAIRVKNSLSQTRTGFRGLDYFPIDPSWRFRARFLPYDPPKKIAIVNVLGMVENMSSPGALEFERDGKTYRIDPVNEEGTTDLFIIVADRTSGKETYGAGRYLYAAPPGPDGTTILDFNKAYNPPCAFTEFATCPLPPPENRLPLDITAGEKKYAGGH